MTICDMTHCVRKVSQNLYRVNHWVAKSFKMKWISLSSYENNIQLHCCHYRNVKSYCLAGVLAQNWTRITQSITIKGTFISNDLSGIISILLYAIEYKHYSMLFVVLLRVNRDLKIAVYGKRL